jgi:formylglycine-generating enzyme required for sulfatase activity
VRGADGRTYPWGNKIDPNRANYDDSGIGTTTAVGCFSQGTSPYDLQDMSGNVWEWLRSVYGKYPYPVTSKEKTERENISSGSGKSRCIRGGSFYFEDRTVRCAYRNGNDPLDWSWNFGIRIVITESSIYPS